MQPSVTPPVSACGEQAVVCVSDAMYREIASRLAQQIGAQEFFNGSVECDSDEFYARFTATLIVYRAAGRVSQIVPVWWEFHMEQARGEVLTDFCWRRLREFMAEGV